LLDWTGCGNTVNTDDPGMRSLIIDSLRYWAVEMRVDGFRFDLAAALDRDANSPDSLIHQIRTHPDLAGLKLIAEPWDATGHYRLGSYPAGVAEWNDRYREAVRRFWRGDCGATPAFVTAICGSDDVIDRASRTPQDSVNFVTAHDGFTLADLVSYAVKHNDATGEDNRDGADDNASSNAGVEGPASDPMILLERRRRQRSLYATLLLSLGVPMISGGDEVGRTQLGNNNAYCQDSPLSWTPWPGDAAFQRFCERVAALRRRYSVFRRDRHLTGHDVTWISPDGRLIPNDRWRAEPLRAFGMWVASDATDSLLLYFNADTADCPLRLPSATGWRVLLDTSTDETALDERVLAGAIDLPAVSMLLLEKCPA
jgi:glycogen operon protein